MAAYRRRLDQHRLGGPSRAERRGPRRVADPEGHQRLPARIAEKSRERPAERRLDAEALLAVRALGRLVQRVEREPARGRLEVQPLPLPITSPRRR